MNGTLSMAVSTNKLTFGKLGKNLLTAPRPHVRDLSHFFSEHMMEVYRFVRKDLPAIGTRMTLSLR